MYQLNENQIRKCKKIFDIALRLVKNNKSNVPVGYYYNSLSKHITQEDIDMLYWTISYRTLIALKVYLNEMHRHSWYNTEEAISTLNEFYEVEALIPSIVEYINNLKREHREKEQLESMTRLHEHIRKSRKWFGLF